MAAPRLLGVWSGGDECDGQILHVLPGEGNGLELVIIAEDDRVDGVAHAIMHFQALPTRLAGRTYLSARAVAGSRGDLPRPFRARDYLILRYELARDGTLSLDYLGGKPVDEAIQAGTLAGTYTRGKGEIDDARVTAETPALRAFVAAVDPAEAFESLCTYRKLAAAPRPRTKDE